MLVTVVVESMFVGSAAGFTQVVVDDSEPVQTIINKFCDVKRAPVDPDYAIINDANINFDGQKRISEYRVQDNDHLRLGRRRQPSQMFRYVNWHRLATVGTALGLLGLIGTCMLYFLLRETPYKFGVVFDAGSTHTDAAVYHWPGGKWRGTGQVQELKSDHCRQVGIANINPENISSYLASCISSAKEAIPSHLLYEAEVFFGATAGMRILEERNRSAVETVLEKVRETLADSGFVYDDSNVNIITGDREGLSGWISVNMLNKTLKDSHASGSRSSNVTIGSLDLGGASVQIALETDASAASSNNPFLNQLSLYEHNYTVYTQSFLCYGADQAMNRYRALLILDQASHGNVSDIISPCDAKGRSYEKMYSDVFGVPCAPLGNSSVAELLSNRSFTFRGSSDSHNCRRNISRVLSPGFCDLVQSEHCLNTTLLPKEVASTKFMAYSAFGHAANNLHLPNRGSQKLFMDRFTRVCENSYDQLIFMHNTFQPQVALRHWEDLCFSGNYMYTLLTKVFGFAGEDDWNRIDFRTKVNGVSVGWSAGYMLNETVYINRSRSVPEIDRVTFIILLCVFSLVLIFGFIFIFHASRLDRHNITTYERNGPSSQQQCDIV